MTRALSIAISLLIMVLLQVSFFPSVLAYSLTPNLVLVGVVMWIVLGDDDVAFLWAFAGGLFLDLFSPDLFGLQALLHLLAALLLMLFRDQVVSTKSRWLHVSLMTVGSAVTILIPTAIRPFMSVFLPDVFVSPYTVTLAFIAAAIVVLNLVSVVVAKPLFTRLTTFFLFVEKRRSAKPFGL